MKNLLPEIFKKRTFEFCIVILTFAFCILTLGARSARATTDLQNITNIYGVGTNSITVQNNLKLNQWLSIGGATPGGNGGTSGYGITLPSTTNDTIAIYGEHNGADGSSGIFYSNDNADDGWTFRNDDCCGGGRLDYARISRNTMYYNGSGNFGIGTSGPNYKLDVQGGQINTSNGLCIAGSCITSWGQAYGYWTLSGNSLYPTSTAYNLGVGNTGPNYKLDVTGDINASTNLREAGTALSGKYAYVGGGNATGTWPINVTGTAAGETIQTVWNRGNTITGNYLYVNSEGVGALRIGAAWGIKGLYAGSSNLTLGVESGNYVYMGISSGDSYVQGGTGNAWFKGNVTTNSGFCIGGNCISSWSQAGGYWSPNGSNIYNNNAGNVGIGTSAPNEKLEVAGSIIYKAGRADNLVQDPQFAQDTTFWSRSGNVTYVYQDLPDGTKVRAARTVTSGAGTTAETYTMQPAIKIDPNKTYRVSVWMKGEGGGTGGTKYLGVNTFNSGGGEVGIVNTSGTAVTNPYFHCGGLPGNDTWYKMVAYIYPSGTPNGWGAPPDANGNGCNVSTTGKFDSNANTIYIRFYNYSYSAGQQIVLFALPTIEEVRSEDNIKPVNNNLYIAQKVGIGTASPDSRTGLQIVGSWLKVSGTNHGDPASRIGVGNNWWMSENSNGYYAIHQNAVGDRLNIDTSGNTGVYKVRADTNASWGDNSGWWTHDPYGYGWGKPHGSFRSLEVSSSGNFSTEPAMFRIHQWGSGAAEFWKPQGTILYLRETPGGGRGWFNSFNVDASQSVGDNYSGSIALGGLSVGRVDTNYGMAGGWTGNTAGILMNSADYTSIKVHDSGVRISEFMYYHGPNHQFQIGRNVGWGAIGSIALAPDGGNVGIGTTGPIAKMDVNGNLAVHPIGCAWCEGLTFYMPNTSTWGGLRWQRQRGGYDGNWYIGYTGLDASDDLVFGANNGGTQIDNILRLTKTSNVLFRSGSRIAINGSSITSAGGNYGFGVGVAWPNLNSIAVDTLESDGGTLELNYYGGGEVHIGSGGSKTLRAGQIYASDWFRANNGTGLYSQSYDMHIWPCDGNANYWCSRSNYGWKIQDRGGSLRGYLYFDGAGFGLLHSGGGWAVRTTPSVTELYNTVYSGPLYSSIFYDRDNSAYYTDPASTSNVNNLVVNGVLTVANMATGNAINYITSIYGANGDMPVRTTATSPVTMRYVYGPFSYATPSCTTGTRYFKLYTEFVDNITSGGQRAYLRILFDGGATRDFDMGSTWGGSVSYRTYLSGFFQESNTNHANIQLWVSGSAGPYVELRKAEIWQYCR